MLSVQPCNISGHWTLTPGNLWQRKNREHRTQLCKSCEGLTHTLEQICKPLPFGKNEVCHKTNIKSKNFSCDRQKRASHVLRSKVCPRSLCPSTLLFPPGLHLTYFYVRETHFQMELTFYPSPFLLYFPTICPQTQEFMSKWGFWTYILVHH